MKAHNEYIIDISCCTSNLKTSIVLENTGTLNYIATDEGIGSAMRSCSKAINSFRRTESQEVEFTEQDREENSQPQTQHNGTKSLHSNIS